MRYFIEFAYDGTEYHGWQIQPNARSVQETLQRAMALFMRVDVELTGAGRTDAGVHASQMFAHFDYDRPLDCEKAVYKLSHILPPDIVVRRIFPVADDAHARFDAKARTYNYYISQLPDPFCRHYSWLLQRPLDIEAMNHAARAIMEYTDFTSFSKVNTDTKTNNCRITHARWTALSDGRLCFTIRADRFLRNMVRAIVGTLIDVGTGKITTNDVRLIIEKKDRCAAGQSVPGNALFLHKVEY